MANIKNFNEFLNEGLSTKDAKDTIKDIFDKFDGEVKDEYLNKVWEEDSTLRELYGKKDFDKAWDELVKAGTISTEDGKCWCWGKKEAVKEGKVFESVEDLMKQFSIDKKAAQKVDKVIDEILSTGDIDERMDIVDQLVLWDVVEDDNIGDEIIEYIKDTYVI